jgi:hypothetical protein
VINCKEYERKLSWPNFKVLSRNFPIGSEKNYEKAQLVWPVSGPRFEPRMSRIQGMSVNHSTTTFSDECDTCEGVYKLHLTTSY